MGTLNLDRIPKPRASKAHRNRRHGIARQNGQSSLLFALVVGTSAIATALVPILHTVAGALAPLGH